MWRAAEESDLDWINDLLRAHVESSMFLIGNLRDHGLGSAAPRGLWLWCLKEGRGVFAISNEGGVLMQAPGADAQAWAAAGARIAGREIGVVLGDAPQVRGFLAANGLEDGPTDLNRDDPGFVLDLAELIHRPRAGEQLRPLEAAPRDLMVRWRAAYEVEAIGMPPEEALVTAQQRVARYIEADSHRVLFAEGQPVAMTGFNMDLGDTVQVGGVFTPASLRGRGLARRAVAEHLLQARGRGAGQAVLFAASDAAAQAYRAIGFRRVGAYALVLFRPAAQIEPEQG